MPVTPAETSFDPTIAERLVQALGRRYLFVLIAVGGLVLVDQAVLQPLLVRLNVYAPVINLAGRQRMLSQRIAKAALGLKVRPDSPTAAATRAELRADLAQWGRVHTGLQVGDADLRLPGTRNAAILAPLRELTPHVEQIESAAEAIAAQPSGTASASDPLDALLKHESAYLSKMDETVGLFETESRAAIARLRFIGLGATTLVLILLAGLGRFVVRPATGLIRDQVAQLAHREVELRAARDELEQRVIERTRELTVANSHLEQEIHDREAAEQRSRELHGQLTHAARVTSLGQLATGLAHELNQPLGAIANFAETADLLLERRPTADGEVTTAVRRIREGALRAGQIVRRMRNFVRATPSDPTCVSLSGLIHEVVELCGPELRQSGARLTLDLDAPGGDSVRVDPIQIQQVLVNLVQNALQALGRVTDRGVGAVAGLPELSISLRRDDNEVCVEVCDNGPGFDANLHAAAFTPFVSTRPDGLGMGLAISRSIVAAHGGRLWAANREEGGARLSFTLPVSVSNVSPLHPLADCVRRG